MKFSEHAVLVGDNNIGKTTILEAIDLVLGPDRLNRFPPIDEHDFYNGLYLANMGRDSVEATDPPMDDESPKITVEVTVTDLNLEQIGEFGDYIEWWDEINHEFYEEANPIGVDAGHIVAALRVTFIGQYNSDEDDFEGKSYYSRSLLEADTPKQFTKKDKQKCGFLYLRTLRTGARAISLERGSLLDIILRIQEVRPQMWEGAISGLSDFTVASDPDLGISGVLESVNQSLKKYMPKEWGDEPRLKVTNLTREHLRKVVTPFVATGSADHSAPFYRQGTGTINMIVLSLLSIIAEAKQNVIFAMEEPEIAIPPYAQKRIVDELRKLSSQSIFTSHSPYVLEEFSIENCMVLARGEDGLLEQKSIDLPASVKLKRYRQEFRTRFCEGLLARRVLLAEGATEASSLPVAARRLSELNPEVYSSLEALGVCTIDAGTETQIADLASLYKGLGKTIYGACDKQSDEKKALIENVVDKLYMHEEKGFEDLVVKDTTEAALLRFSELLQWPDHILKEFPVPEDNLIPALLKYFKWSKGAWGIADFLATCYENEFPEWIRSFCISIKEDCQPEPVPLEDQVFEDEKAEADR